MRSSLAMHILTTLVATLLCSSYNVRLAVAQQEEQASTEYTKDDEFKDAVMNVSNTYRKQHNATALAWNGSLAEGAAEWSERCVFEHSGGPTGENLSSGYRNASASIIAWGHERVDYDFKKGGFSKETGHFTQLVWKATTSFGCGRTECNGEGGKEAPGWFVVCNYYPPGNVIGAFTENVQGQVPEEEQPEGPSDPEVPDNENDEGEGGKECPQGGVCGAAGRLDGRGAVRWSGLLSLLVVWACG